MNFRTKAWLWWLACALGAGAGAADDLPQEAYIWQRDWTPAVKESVEAHAGSFAELTLLSGEITWSAGRPILTRVALPYGLLRGLRTPVGLALRIGPFGGPFSDNDETAKWIAGMAGSIAREAQTNGVRARELQIDFDCAESKLDGYATWLRAIKAATPAPVTITALPSWLGKRAFGELAAECGNYVLQVHSLERPKSFDAPFALCDPEAARRAVQKAGEIGTPFRVALPTYGYLLAFAPNGQFVGLSAEGLNRSWPARARLREVGADPLALSELARGWAQKRPMAMRGIIWYRLPNAEDTLNWRWPTLDAMVHLRRPREEFHAEARRVGAGLYDINLVNGGELDISSRLVVNVHWQEARLAAGDGLRGFDLAEGGEFSAKFETQKPARLRAGEQWRLGWIRLTRDVEVKLESKEE